MEGRTMWTKAAALLCLIVLISSCGATRQSRNMDRKGIIVDYSRLQKGGENQPQYVYFKENVDWKKYDSIILDPITIWRGDESRKSGASAEEAQQVVNQGYKIYYDKLSKHFKMVREPGPNTLRIQVLLTKLDESNVTMDVATSIVPQMVVLQSGTSAISGKTAFKGGAGFEGRWRDAETGEVLFMAAGERGGTKKIGGSLDSWSDVRKAFDEWSTRATWIVCTQTGKSGCKK